MSGTSTEVADAIEWSRIAWQGLRFSVPSDWNPLEVSGSRKRGALRLGDLHHTTMQIDWRAAGRRHRADRVWKRYLKRQLGLKPRNAVDRMTDRPALVERLHDGGWVDVTAARLDDRGGSIHALVRGSGSRRFVLIRVPLGAEGDEAQVVSRIFTGLRESEPDRPENWSLYGFGFQVPGGSRLNHWRLRAGHLELNFQCRGLRIVWQRIALAKRTLGDRSLAAWLEQHTAPKKRRIAWRPGPAAPRDGCVLERPARWFGRLRPASWLTAGRAVAWHLTDADQLVVLTIDGQAQRMESVFAMLCESWSRDPRATATG